MLFGQNRFFLIFFSIYQLPRNAHIAGDTIQLSRESEISLYFKYITSVLIGAVDLRRRIIATPSQYAKAL
jgi:hypothetical protein